MLPIDIVWDLYEMMEDAILHYCNKVLKSNSKLVVLCDKNLVSTLSYLIWWFPALQIDFLEISILDKNVRKIFSAFSVQPVLR